MNDDTAAILCIIIMRNLLFVAYWWAMIHFHRKNNLGGYARGASEGDYGRDAAQGPARKTWLRRDLTHPYPFIWEQI